MRIILTILVLISARLASAAPVICALAAEKSTVGFETDFGPEKINGWFPVTRADLVLDFDRIANCPVRVTLDIASATASFPFATHALKGPKLLDAAP